MWQTDGVLVDCPYCGEQIEIVVDLSEAEQSYVEDCSVCCRPIVFSVTVDDEGNPNVVAAHEND
jgi:hypothetical protein